MIMRATSDSGTLPFCGRLTYLIDVNNITIPFGFAGQCLHDEAVRYESRLVSISDAINESRRRLEQARQHEAQAFDREKTKRLRERLTAFTAAARRKRWPATPLAQFRDIKAFSRARSRGGRAACASA